MKRAERAKRYEKHYDQERVNRQAAEAKCSSCLLVRHANEEFIERRIAPPEH